MAELAQVSGNGGSITLPAAGDADIALSVTSWNGTIEQAEESYHVFGSVWRRSTPTVKSFSGSFEYVGMQMIGISTDNDLYTLAGTFALETGDGGAGSAIFTFAANITNIAIENPADGVLSIKADFVNDGVVAISVGA